MIYATVHSYNSIEVNRSKDFSWDQAGYAISLVDSLLSPPTHQSPKSSARSFLASACKRHRESSTQQLLSCVAVGWLVLSFNVVSSKVLLLYKTVLWSMLLGTRGQSTIIGALLSGNHLVGGEEQQYKPMGEFFPGFSLVFRHNLGQVSLRQ